MGKAKPMTYERLMYLAKMAGFKAKELEYSETPPQTNMLVLYDDGNVEINSSLQEGAWNASTKAKDTLDYDTQNELRFGFVKNGQYVAYVNVKKYKLSSAIKTYPDGVPLYVGTKQVSAIYVKQNGTIKPAKPYIKTSGQIKAL